VISTVIAQMADQNLVLKITGQELSKNASFKIGQDEVKPVNVTVVPGDPDDHANGLFKTLTVTIRRPPSGWQKADVGLTLISPIRMASWPSLRAIFSCRLLFNPDPEIRESSSSSSFDIGFCAEKRADLPSNYFVPFV
jgi:hypothetical protein